MNRAEKAPMIVRKQGKVPGHENAPPKIIMADWRQQDTPPAERRK
jgi:hypothetical protein